MSFLVKSLFSKLIRNKKGQVRGVDFTLATLIFVLVLTQVLLLLGNIVEPNIDQIDSSNTYEKATTLISQLTSSGLPINWGTSFSLPADFSFGLSLPGSEWLDFSKISRISPSSSSNWLVDYNTIAESLKLESNLDIAIEISPVYSVTINQTIFHSANTVIDVDGRITSGGLGVNYSRIWIFAIHESGQALSNSSYVFTDSNGYYSSGVDVTTVNTLAEDDYLIAVFCQIGASQSYQVAMVSDVLGTLTLSPGVSVLQGNTSSGNTLLVEADTSLVAPTSANATIVYPYSDTSSNHTTTLVLDTSFKTDATHILKAPVNGSAIVFVTQRSATENQYGFCALPVFIDGDIIPIITPGIDIPEIVIQVTSQMRICRQVPLVVRIWIW
ncbi:MAG: hypothetical protein KAR35_00090 [Candidatus Heimdallarchaeota archaeon]|nr:hypothetical protein [Candidatus Heimdallarchaeota archaeon]MCK5047749.1 hypothetical protein [Candidatus Heimdallarchaeota archaeon]